MLRRELPIALLATTVSAIGFVGCADSAAAGPIEGFAPGDWRAYGADPTGATDSTSAIQRACDQNDLSLDAVGGRYLITAAIQIRRPLTVRGQAGRTTLICPDGNFSAFIVTGVSGACIEGLRIQFVGVGTRDYTSGIEFSGSSACIARDCEISGSSWAGVFIRDSGRCVVTRCWFHGFQGTQQDSADICVYNNSSDNVVTENRCEGGNYHGILIQDSYAGAFPSHNRIAQNSIGAHRAYGVCLYLPDLHDTFNHVIDNHIEGIEGSAFNYFSGPGIYVAGAGIGGTQITGNTILRTCLQTRARGESPGAIGLHGLDASSASISITNNIIDEIAAYDGILVLANAGPILISGNSVRVMSGNGTGTPIRVENSSNVAVVNNTLSRPITDGGCLLVYANGGKVDAVSVVGNLCSGGNYAQIDFQASAGGSFSNIVCSTNNLSGAGDSPSATAITIDSALGGVIANNCCSTRQAVSLYVRNVAAFRIDSNVFITGGPESVRAEGACQNTLYASGNYQTGIVTNAAQGFVVGP